MPSRKSLIHTRFPAFLMRLHQHDLKAFQHPHHSGAIYLYFIFDPSLSNKTFHTTSNKLLKFTDAYLFFVPAQLGNSPFIAALLHLAITQARKTTSSAPSICITSHVTSQNYASAKHRQPSSLCTSPQVRHAGKRQNPAHQNDTASQPASLSAISADKETARHRLAACANRALKTPVLSGRGDSTGSGRRCRAVADPGQRRTDAISRYCQELRPRLAR